MLLYDSGFYNNRAEAKAQAQSNPTPPKPSHITPSAPEGKSPHLPAPMIPPHP